MVVHRGQKLHSRSTTFSLEFLKLLQRELGLFEPLVLRITRSQMLHGDVLKLDPIAPRLREAPDKLLRECDGPAMICGHLRNEFNRHRSPRRSSHTAPCLSLSWSLARPRPPCTSVYGPRSPPPRD